MYYKINGVKMPSFTSFKPESNNLYGENTGRDEAGYLHLDLIRANVRKWTITHEFITRAELDKIKKACGALDFDLEAMTNEGYITARCYANIKNEQCVWYEDNTSTGSYWSCEIALIEM